LPLPLNPNMFANNPLDRAGRLRTDEEGLAAARKAGGALVLPFFKGRPFTLAGQGGMPGELGWLRTGLLDDLTRRGAVEIFLGLEKGQARFALDVGILGDPEQQGPLAGLGTFADLRPLAASLPGGDAAMCAQAKAMLEWHATHGFCARCGDRSQVAEAGWKRICTACGGEHFPRTDPVVIMLATRGDLALVGRGKAFPPGMFSALAGFVEPGETIEEAVARELEEEAGIRVSSVSYHSTQPWPFPMSLMIGCHAEAETADITLDESELAEARWESRANLAAVLAGSKDHGFWLPPPLAIAHQIIKAWVNAG